MYRCYTIQLVNSVAVNLAGARLSLFVVNQSYLDMAGVECIWGENSVEK